MLAFGCAFALSCFDVEWCNATELRLTTSVQLRLMGDNNYWECPAIGSCPNYTRAVNALGLVLEYPSGADPACLICVEGNAPTGLIFYQYRCGGLQNRFRLLIFGAFRDPLPGVWDCQSSHDLWVEPAADSLHADFKIDYYPPAGVGPQIYFASVSPRPPRTAVSGAPPASPTATPAPREPPAPEECVPERVNPFFLLVSVAAVAITLMVAALLLWFVWWRPMCCGEGKGAQSAGSGEPSEPAWAPSKASQRRDSQPQPGGAQKRGRRGRPRGRR